MAGTDHAAIAKPVHSHYFTKVVRARDETVKAAIGDLVTSLT
jgi:hypothetical protein